MNQPFSGQESQQPQPQQPYQQFPVPQQPEQAYGQQPSAPGQPAAPAGQPYGYGQPMPPAPSSKATGALVCGIMAIVFAWLPLVGIVLGIVAIVLAGKAVKESGKNGKTTGGKACGIAGIVLAVIVFFLYLAFGVGVLMYAANSGDYAYVDADGTTQAPSASSEADAQMEAVAAAQYDLLKNKDAAVVQQLAADLDEGLKDATDYSLTELGIDPVAFAEWMLDDFSYQLDGATDNGDGTGTAYADVTMRDSMAFANTFIADAQAAVDAGELEGLDEAGAKAKLAELYQGAMDKTTEVATAYSSLELVQEGDTWKVDPESWSDEVDYLLGLY